MKKITTILLAVSVMILTAGFALVSYAATETVASGTIGTCEWDVNSNGVMTIHTGTISYDESDAADIYFSEMWGNENLGYMFEDPEYRCGYDDETGEEIELPEEIMELPVITKVRTDGKVTVRNAAFLFHGFSSVEEFDLAGFSTSGVKWMNYMFNGCYAMKSLDISGFDTSSVTTMDRMFDSCSSLESINVSGLDTSRVTNMFGMFQDCYSLRSVDLSSFNTSSVTDMSTMFYGCSNLESVDLSSFGTGGCIATWMFYDCEALREIKCGNWNERCGAEFPVDMVKTSTGELYKADELIPTGQGLRFVVPADYEGTIQPRIDLEKKSIAKATVTVGKAYYTGGYAVKPSVKVTLGGKTLTSGTDYTLAWTNNKKVGKKAKVTVKGTGAYKSSVTKTFTIYRRPLKNNVQINLAQTSFTYSGSAKKPKFSIYIPYANAAGMISLVNKTDYTYSYSNNKEPGTAKLTVTGKGNYTGTVTRTFKIEKKKQPATLTTTDKKVSYTAIKDTFKIKYKNRKEYAKVTYSTTNSKVATVSTSGTVKYVGGGSCVIKVHFAATKHYKAVTRSINVVVLKKQTIACDISSGSQITYFKGKVPLGARLTAGNGTLTYKSSDRSVMDVDSEGNIDMSNATKVGTATITITASKTDTYGTTTKSVKISTIKALPVIRCNTDQHHSVDSAPFSIGASTEAGVALTYTSSDTKIATVDSNGVVTINADYVENTLKDSATVDITINSVENSFYRTAKPVTVKLTVECYTISYLQKKFPARKYWNHVVPASESGTDCKNEAYADSWTDTPCASHGALAYTGQHDCNYFDGAIQCMGFARYMGYLYSGKKSRVSGWQTTGDISGLKVGDVLQYHGAETDNAEYGHTVFVIGVNGDEITVGECNAYIDNSTDSKCVINWGRKIYKSQIWNYTRYIFPGK